MKKLLLGLFTHKNLQNFLPAEGKSQVMLLIIDSSAITRPKINFKT
jgi:hypothetical protein